MSTENISLKLEEWTKNKKEIPYFISLQNGVENEDIMCKHYNKEFVIGGLTRLIAAHTITLGHVESTGEVQTILGAIYPTKQNQEFLEKLKKELDKTDTTTFLSPNIKLELWNKLIINNGLNAICALLSEKTGTLINDKKVSKLIYGLMSETALASKVAGVDITKENVDKMFELMTNFESIKPSMLIDLEKFVGGMNPVQRRVLLRYIARQGYSANALQVFIPEEEKRYYVSLVDSYKLNVG